MNSVVNVGPMSNREFLERHAKPGCVGLAGGETLVDRAIRMAERHVCDGEWSNWSHAFVFGERRSDGQIWVIESDLQAARKHIRFGVQENRISKYSLAPPKSLSRQSRLGNWRSARCRNQKVGRASSRAEIGVREHTRCFGGSPGVSPHQQITASCDDLGRY